ncbi:hypothetical protein N8524_09240 [Candidatus Puniceispirillum sp.]|nr:hypothetical protein [Candidatus Puniceispirillum sp.]
MAQVLMFWESGEKFYYNVFYERATNIASEIIVLHMGRALSGKAPMVLYIRYLMAKRIPSGVRVWKMKNLTRFYQTLKQRLMMF